MNNTLRNELKSLEWNIARRVSKIHPEQVYCSSLDKDECFFQIDPRHYNGEIIVDPADIDDGKVITLDYN